MPLAALQRALAGTSALLALLLLAAPAAAVDVGGPAPVFSLPTADGQPIVLDKLRGQVV